MVSTGAGKSGDVEDDRNEANKYGGSKDDDRHRERRQSYES